MHRSSVQSENVIPFPAKARRAQTHCTGQIVATVTITLDDEDRLTLSVTGAHPKNAMPLCEALNSVALKLARLAQGKSIET